MLVSTNGNADQTFTSPALLYNGTAVTSGVTYSIAEKPPGFTDEIAVNAATGQVTFGKVLYDKMTPTDPTQPTGPPATVTVRAAYRGKTASYTFTVTDHFSPREDHTAVVMNGDIYVIGGSLRSSGGTAASPTAAIQSNEVWRSADGGLTWDQAATGARFTPRADHGSVALNGVLYVIAGRHGEGGVTTRDDVWRSNDRGANWSRVNSSVQFPMDYSFASAVRGDTLYVLGGIRRSPFARLNEVWQSVNFGVNWTNITATATTSPPRFLTRSAPASVVLGNAGAAKLYVIGGYDSVSGNDLDDIWESSDGTSWTQVNASAAASDKFPGRSEHSAAAVSEAGGDTIYVIGGSRGANSRSDVWKSVDQGATWDPVAANAEFSNRADHASVVRDGELYVIGGAGSFTELFNDVWKSADGGVTWVNVHKVTAAK